MNRIFPLIICMFVAISCFAEDIIVMRSGDIVKANVLEIGQSEIKYKKATNPNGPTYTINKSEVLSINYENGESDKFEAATSVTPEKKNEQDGVAVNAPNSELNKAYIEKNSPENVKFIGEKTDKPAEQIILLYKPDEGSVLCDENLEIQMFSTGAAVSFYEPSVNITLRNKTNRILYVDLGNCFFICNNEATPYYVPSVTSTTQTSTGGVGLNLGAVASALGVGGVVGSLASGVNVSGSKGSATSTMTFSERVLRLPPMSAHTLEGAVVSKWSNIKDTGLDFGRAGTYSRLVYQLPKTEQLTEGEERYEFSKDIFPKMSSIITYSIVEDLSAPVVLSAAYSPYKMLAGKIKKSMDLRFLRDSDYSSNLKDHLFVTMTHRKKK